MSLDVSSWKIQDVRNALRNRQASAREICAAALAKITEQNPRNNAFLTVTEERAMARAAAVDRQVAAGGEWGPLAGVPLARIHADRFVAPGASGPRVPASAGPCN